MTMEKSISLNYDRRYYSRQPSFGHHHHQQQLYEPHTPPPISIDSYSHNKPFLLRSVTSIDIPPPPPHSDPAPDALLQDQPNFSVISLLHILRSGNNKPMNKLFLMISLNFAYSTFELLLGLFTGRIGLVSDAFHLTFGCGLLTFSLFAMAASRSNPDPLYTYGFKRLEVLSAFTNALFLLFMSFSLAVEALHAFIQDESEHKHYLIVSATTNLLVNLIGVWFFRNYARINLGDSTVNSLKSYLLLFNPATPSLGVIPDVSDHYATYRKAEDMNYHSVCLHVLADSIRSAGLILASWFLALGVQNAEVLCLGIVSITIFTLVMPLFKTTGGILLQMAPLSIPSSALSKCMRQIISQEDVVEVSQIRFWEFVPSHVVGSLSVKVKSGINDNQVLHFVHDLYHDLGIHEVTVQIDNV